MYDTLCRSLAVLGLAAAIATPAAAQDDAGDDKSGRVVRITLGPQAYPAFPGSEDYDIGPLVNIDRKKPGETFIFEAPDESFDFHLVDTGGFTFGPVANFEGKRSASDLGADVHKVKFSLEPGVFVGFQPSDNFRLRAELRKGVTGHKGWIGVASADYVMRDGDDWLFSIGPRLTWTDNKYQDAWFGVTPDDALASGLPVYDPDGGIQAYGATATFLTRFSPRWGIYTYAKYDRLVGGAADSPIVVQLGSRDQFSGGIGLSYTFGL